MTDQGPRSGSEEWVCLDIRSARSCTKSFRFILDKQFSNKRFTQTGQMLDLYIKHLAEKYNVLGNLLRPTMFWKWNFISKNIGEGGSAVLAFERRGSV